MFLMFCGFKFQCKNNVKIDFFIIEKNRSNLCHAKDLHAGLTPELLNEIDAVATFGYNYKYNQYFFFKKNFET